MSSSRFSRCFLVLRPRLVRLGSHASCFHCRSSHSAAACSPGSLRRPIHLLQLSTAALSPRGPRRQRRPRLNSRQAQNQRPPNRHVRLLVQPLDDGPGIRTQRTQAMDQVAPHRGSGLCLSSGQTLSGWLSRNRATAAFACRLASFSLSSSVGTPAAVSFDLVSFSRARPRSALLLELRDRARRIACRRRP